MDNRAGPEITTDQLRAVAAALGTGVVVTVRAIVTTGGIDKKLVLARHLYDDVQLLTSIRTRLRELNAACEQLPDLESRETLRPDGPRLDTCEDDAILNLLYRTFKPRLSEEIRTRRINIHPVWDEPTARILDQCIRTLEAQFEEASAFLNKKSNNELRNNQDIFLHRPIRSSMPLPAMPGRSNEFEIVETVSRPPLTTPPPLLKAALLHYLLMSTEIPTIEHCAALIWDHAQETPWEFVEDMSRQCWDEARHAQACILGLKELGHRPGDFPIEISLWRMTLHKPLALRLAIHQRLGEWLGLDAALWWATRLEGSGDTATADMFRFIANDERSHVAFGNKWLRFLLQTDAAIRLIHEEAEAVRASCGAGTNRTAPFPINVEECTAVGFSPSEVGQLTQERKAGEAARRSGAEPI